VTSDVNNQLRQKLKNLGVLCVDAPVLKNPYEGQARYNPRFGDVMSKLNIWNLTQYETVVFLDADTLVYHNVDELFECGEFCVAFINPTTFNSGVMVLKPSKKVFDDMYEKVASGSVKSYDGGDQGFLNNYYPDMLSAPVFENSTYQKHVSKKRLPSQYHTDHILFYPRFRWDVVSPKIIEFIGVPLLKPWLWWSYPLMELSSSWFKYRRNLPVGTSDLGLQLFHAFCLYVIGLAVFITLTFVSVRYELRIRSLCSRFLGTFPLLKDSASSDNLISLISGSIGLFCFLISGYIGFSFVPATMPPNYAFPVFFLWTYGTLFFTFGSWCWLLSWRGRTEEGLGGKYIYMDTPLNSSLFWGYTLVSCTIGFISLVFKRGFFTEVFHKLTAVAFGLILMILIHFSILSRIAFYWYTAGPYLKHNPQAMSSIVVGFLILSTMLLPASYIFS